MAVLGGAAHDRGFVSCVIASPRSRPWRRSSGSPRPQPRSLRRPGCSTDGRRHRAAVRLRQGDRADRLGRVRGRLRPRRRQGPDPGPHQPPGRGPGARLQGAGRLRAQPVPRRHRRPGQPRRRLRLPAAGAPRHRERAASGRALARQAHRPQGQARPAGQPARHARRLLRPARLRGRARRERRHVQLAGLPGRRRRRRDARHEGRDRLAQRPRARLRRRRRTRSPPTGRTGDVGMVGTSYNGTLPNQVATTGVEGLKTIIPVSAISSWYDYYRANGLVVAPHSNTNGAGENGYLGEDTDVLGDYIGGPRMEDPNGEVPLHARLPARRAGPRDRRLLGLLGRARLPRQGRPDHARACSSSTASTTSTSRRRRSPSGGTGSPRTASSARSGCTTAATAGRAATARRPTRDARHRWFDHYLFGVANGIQGEPRATVQREDGAYRQEADWPAPGTSRRDARARLGLAHRAGHAVGQAPERRPAAVHRPRPRARHRRRADPGARHGEPEPARLPDRARCHATCA